VQSGGFEVDAEELCGIGGKMVGVATTLRSAVKGAGPGLAPAGGAGSAAAAAAQAAESAWVADLQRLSGEVDEFGKGLTKTANDYTTSDQASAHGVRRSGAQADR
jgi:hypothetical protein